MSKRAVTHRVTLVAIAAALGIFLLLKGFSSGAGAAAVSFYGAGVLAGRFVWGIIASRLSVHRALVLYGFGYGVSIILSAGSSMPNTVVEKQALHVVGRREGTNHGD